MPTIEELEEQLTAAEAKVKEFRDNNITILRERDGLKDQLGGFEGIDAEKYRSMLSQQDQIERDELIKKGDVDELLKRDRDAFATDFTKRLDAVQTENESLKREIIGTKVTDELRKAATGAKVKGEAVDDLVKLAGSEWVLENGAAVRKTGDDVVLSTERPGENQTMPEYFAELAQSKPFYFEPSQGGGGQGQPGGGGGGVKVLLNPTPQEMGRNAEAIASGAMVIKND